MIAEITVIVGAVAILAGGMTDRLDASAADLAGGVAEPLPPPVDAALFRWIVIGTGVGVTSVVLTVLPARDGDAGHAKASA